MPAAGFCSRTNLSMQQRHLIELIPDLIDSHLNRILELMTSMQNRVFTPPWSWIYANYTKCKQILPAIVSDYMETLFNDRAIVSDRQCSSATAFIWKHFSVIGRSSAIVSDPTLQWFRRSSNREQSYGSQALVLWSISIHASENEIVWVMSVMFLCSADSNYLKLQIEYTFIT